MLHSALPRAFLEPSALGFQAVYYEELQHLQQQHAQQQQQLPSYASCVQQDLSEWHARINEHWQLAARDSGAAARSDDQEPAPCPLDLSVKQPQAPPSPALPRPGPSCAEDAAEQAIEVDDEEDRRSREEARSQYCASEGRYQPSEPPREPEEHELVVDDEGDELESRGRCSSANSYQQQRQRQSSRSPAASQLASSYERSPPGQRDSDFRIGLAYESERFRAQALVWSGSWADVPPEHSKLLLGSPSQQLPTSYQHLLQTPPQSHQQQQQQLQAISAPMTPPSTPSPPQAPRRKHREQEEPGLTPGLTPMKSVGRAQQHPQSSGSSKQHAKRKQAVKRKIKFDEETSSPVSGTIILRAEDVTMVVAPADINPAGNIVDVSEEARAELAKIENKLGPYTCMLCQNVYEDAFKLAQHHCSRIVNIQYRCPDCEKRFTCPANLASHRRWHKPQANSSNSSSPGKRRALLSNAASSSSSSALLDLPSANELMAAAAAPCPESSGGLELSCSRCEAKFSQHSALRKHVKSQHPDTESNNNNIVTSNNNNNSKDSPDQMEERKQLEQPSPSDSTAMEIA